MDDVDTTLKIRDALYNAISVLPVGVKNHPGVFVQAGGGTMIVSATDGYIYIATKVDVPTEFFRETFLDKAAAKALMASEIPLADMWCAPENRASWEHVEVLDTLNDMALETCWDTTMNTLTYSADRIKKLGSLKPAGEFPLVVIPARDNGVWYARFTYGQATYGVFTLLEPS